MKLHEDVLADEFVDNYITINNHPVHRPDVLKDAFKKGYNAAHEENIKLKSALNKIGMLGMGAMAYTKDFTEEVRTIVREALGLDVW